jgi:hypothetical protein
MALLGALEMIPYVPETETEVRLSSPRKRPWWKFWGAA